MLIAAGGAREIAQACALLSERHYLPARSASTTSDLLSALDDWRTMPPHVERVAKEIEELAKDSRLGKDSRPLFPFSESDFRRAILAGYPDRVAQRRDPTSPRVRLASGAGAVIGPESGVHDGEFLVALDVVSDGLMGVSYAKSSFPPYVKTRAGHALPAVPPGEARIRLASRVERDWLEPNQADIVHRFDPDAGIVRAARIERYDALVLAEHPTRPDDAIAAGLLADAWKARSLPAADEQCCDALRLRADR
jgi:ATP-dependent helicase HrpB